MRNIRKGLIFDVQSFCVHDGPGIRSVVFFKGCNLRCVWCQNPESISIDQELSYSVTRCIHCGSCIDACPHNAILPVPEIPTLDRKLCQKCMACVQACPSMALRTVGTWMTVDEVMEKVEAERIFFENSGGGVTFSGGEPLVQFYFLKALLQEAGRRHFHRALETNGQLPEKQFAQLLSHVELVLFDVKHLEAGVHERLTGVSNRLIQRNLERLAREHKVQWIPRFPFVPGMNDDAKYIKELAHRMKVLGAKEIHLLPYHRLGDSKRKELGHPALDLMERISPPSRDKVEKAALILERQGLSVIIGG